MGFFQNMVDGFKPAIQPPTKDIDSVEYSFNDNDKEKIENDQYGDATVAVKNKDEGLLQNSEDTTLKRGLQARHIQFIAIGGSIGTGLFIATGENLHVGGPGFLMIDFIIVAIMIITVVFALGELAACFPVTGAFSTYAVRFIDPSWGFACGYNYWLQWLVALPLEATAATMVIRYWDQDQVVPRGVWIAIFLIIVGFVNLFGVRGYGEFEFFASVVKIIGVIGFIICAIVIDCGGTPANHYFGAEGWHKGDAFKNGFKGFSSVFINAAFAYSGSEIVGLAAAETENPRKHVPKASKQVLFRVLLFYLLSLFMISLIVSSDDPLLMSGSDSNDPSASPFVIALQRGEIYALPKIFNAVILISTLSVGNASVYGGSRTLLALAEQGMAPKIFRYVDREGRPLPSVILSLLFGLLGFLSYSSDPQTVFSWLISISGLSAIFAWASTCLAHIFFRLAWVKQGNHLIELPWCSPFGIWGSIFGFILNLVVIGVSAYVGAFPIGEGSMDPAKRADNFFNLMVSLPIAIVFFVLHKLIYRTRWLRFSEMDIQTGRRDPIPLEVLEQEQAELRERPLFKKIFEFFF